MTYSLEIPIEFAHCDPAGIVYFPRFVEMAQRVVENYFIDELDHPFSAMVGRGEGVPAVRLEVDFAKPAQLGDRLQWQLEVEHLGRTSIRFLITAEDRLTVRLTVVWVGADMVPMPVPDPVRTKMGTNHA